MPISLPRVNPRKLYARLYNLAVDAVTPIDGIVTRRRQRRFVGCLVAITGSVGKTTAAIITSQLLADQATVVTGAIQNAGTHVTRQVRRLRRPVDYVVQEVSGHRTGALDSAVKTLRIDVAVVTAVGLDHVKNFRTREAVAAEKGRLVEAVPLEGFACLNADDIHVRGMAPRCKGRVILYGRAADAEVRAENVSAELPARLSFDLVVGHTRRRVVTRFPGTLMLPSILSALAVLHGRGLDLDRAVRRLAGIEPFDRRLEVVEGGRHIYVLDNLKAPLWSTRALVEDLENWGPRPRIFVLAEMSDIQGNSSYEYKRILRDAAAVCTMVIGTDRAAGQADKLSRGKASNVTSEPSLDKVREILAAAPPSVVILKASRNGPLGELANERVEPGTR